jgi:nitrite reductase (NADH) large subunit
MGGLFLLGDDWYEQRGITCWLNTSAAAVDMGARQVILGTGDRLPYDRLILATGARAAVLALPGDRLPGWFVLREVTDAMAIRAYVQETRAVDAVVVGAGPLGVEAACALHELGLAVTLLARGPDLLRQHVDARCAALIRRYLTGRGIAVLSDVEPAALDGGDRLAGVVLTDGRRVPADLALVCTGMAPEAGLARAAGIPVGRGVLVDTAMRARVPDVLAAGDVAEVEGRVAGLWPAAVAQATTAAHTALGLPAPATDGGPFPVLLKGLGIDVASAGRIIAGVADTVVHHESPDGTAYGRLILHDGRVAGAVLLNLPADAPDILAAVRAGTPVDGPPALRSGRWQPSATTAPAPRREDRPSRRPGQ